MRRVPPLRSAASHSAVRIRSRRIRRTRAASASPLSPPDTQNAPFGASCVSGGESGIRTHGRFDPSPVFKTGALNRSAISPLSGTARDLVAVHRHPAPAARPAPAGETPQERVRRLQLEAEEERLRLAEEARKREEAEAREREAEAEAKATTMVSESIAASGTQALNYFIAQKYTDAISQFATSPNAKTILFPVEATHVMMFRRSIGDYAVPDTGLEKAAVPPTFPRAVARYTSIIT